MAFHSRRRYKKFFGGSAANLGGLTLDELVAFLRSADLLLKVLRYLSLPRRLFVGRYHNGFYVELGVSLSLGC